MAETKFCKKCSKHKPKNDFGLRTNKVWLRAWCLKCERKIAKKWAEDNFDRHRLRQKLYYIKRKYGITESELENMLSRQNNGCGICKIELTINDSRLAIDHDHNTSKVRGVLCMNCNVALGHFKDNIDFLKAAISYLTLELE